MIKTTEKEVCSDCDKIQEFLLEMKTLKEMCEHGYPDASAMLAVLIESLSDTINQKGKI